MKTEGAAIASARVRNVPLCVDLDGTLLKTDMLVESFVALLRRKPVAAVLAPIWLLKGKAHLKEQIARRIDLEVASLPYDEEFLRYLQTQHQEGRRLVLATASNKKFAEAVASHFGLFENVIASDATSNLSGAAKLERLHREYGKKGFDYAGNSRADIPILQAARRAVLVRPEHGVRSAIEQDVIVERIFDGRHVGGMHYLRALRIHQWIKNVLLFVPLTAAHRMADAELLGQAGLAFLSFSLCASSVYLLNDTLDVAADRAHPRKRLRPLASGELPIVRAAVLMPALLFAAVMIATLLPFRFLLALGVYYAVTVAYSMWLKRIVLVDILVLAALYTIRILAGGYAVSIVPSFWLLAFSMFIFLSLAMVKRYSELLEMDGAKIDSPSGRGYHASDMPILLSHGGACGQVAVLVLALYINSVDVTMYYRHPELIWLLCPLLLYWITRMWLAAARGKMHDDPVVFAVKDRISHLIAFLFLVIVYAAV